MKNTLKILSLLLALALLLGCLAACRKDPVENSAPEDTEHKDYAALNP